MAIKKSKKTKFDLTEVKGVKVTTPKFITSFPKLFKPEAYQGGSRPAYSVLMLFKKDQDISELKKAVTRAKVEAFGKDKTKWPEIKTPWRDGEEMADYNGFEGMIYANAKTYNRPLVIDRNKEKIDNPEDVYPGCIGRAVVVVKATESGGNYFITFYLQGYQKVEDGEPLAGGASTSDFGDLDDEDEDDLNDTEDYEDDDEGDDEDDED